MQASSALYLLPTLTLLAACGHGGDDAATAALSIRLTDAPATMDDIDRVCLAIEGVTIHYAGGEERTLDYDPRPEHVGSATHCFDDSMMPWNGTDPVPPVRLSALGGSLTVALVESLQVPIGTITWIRLHLAPGESYLAEDNGGTFMMSDDLLRCPSCERIGSDRQGIKLNRNIEVTSAGVAFTLDFDLGVSLIQNPNGYTLRPVIRVELDGALGTVSGVVDSAVITPPGDATLMTPYADTGCAVYVFPDDPDLMVPDDYYAGVPNATTPVVTTARVRVAEDDLGTLYFGYAAGALTAGDYQVALTCNPDNPEENDENIDANTAGAVLFSDLQPALVMAGMTTRVDFTP